MHIHYLVLWRFLIWFFNITFDIIKGLNIKKSKFVITVIKVGLINLI